MRAAAIFVSLMLIVPLILTETTELAPWLARKLLRWGARQLGSTDWVAKHTEEWLANLELVPGKFTKLAHAVGVVVLGVPRLRRQYARKSRTALDESVAKERISRPSQRSDLDLASLAPVGIGLFDGNERLVDANDALCRLLGYTPDQLRGVTSDALTHPDDRSSYLSPVRKLLASGQNNYTVPQVVLLRADGEPVYCELHISMSVQDDGQQFWFVMFDDITQQRRVTELQRYQRKFVANASHVLRAPLSVIRAYAEFAAGSGAELPDEMAYALQRVKSETERMTTLVNDLLLLTRLDAELPVANELVDIWGLVIDATSDVRVAAPGHNWQFDLPEGPIVVQGDEDLLQRVLRHLLTNARTHTPTGTTVLVRLTADGDGHAVLTVTDDGPGISAELLPDKVFDRFTRSVSTRLHAGLGLAVVASVVQTLGGSVEATSQPGRTTFTVRLPLSNGLFP